MSKMAVIVPYRDRRKQLDIFIPHFDEFMKDKDIDYKIFVIEQRDDRPFNRGKLINVGCKEIPDEYDYFCFHDVDMLPMSDDCDYSYPHTPRHIAGEVEAHNYQLPFVEYIGGVFLITREDFKKINGYSNEYWGWGVEDLDLLFRIRESDISLESHIDIFNVTKQPRYPLDDVIVRPNINATDVKELYSLDFDGKSTYTTLPTNPHIDNITSDSFTFSCWVYPKSIPLEDGDSYGIVQRPGFHTGIEYMNDEGNGAFRVGCWDMDDNYYFVKSRRVTFQWYNVCCVVDKKIGDIKLYINGIVAKDFDGKSEFGKAKLRDYRGKHYFIGSSDSETNCMDGRISSVSIFDYPLLPNEIGTIYQRGVSNPNVKSKNPKKTYNTISPPVAYFSFKNGYHNIIFDDTKKSLKAQVSNFDESQLKKENLFPDAKTDLPVRKRGLYKSTDKSTTKEDIETFRNYVLPFYNHGRYATNQYYNKDFINTFTAIDLVEKKGGRYKSLVHEGDDTIVQRYLKGEYGDKSEPDLELNKSIFYDEVITGRLKTNQIGLNSVKYKLVDSYEFDNDHHWIGVII